MEAQGFFVVGADVVHFVPVLVADAVVDGFEGDGWEDQVQGVLGGGLEAEAREEEAAVVLALDQGVSGLSVGLDGGGLDVAEFTFVDGVGGFDGGCSCRDCGVVDGLHVVDFECHICFFLSVNSQTQRSV